MDDDYLWAKSGAPDAEVERLEKLLARYRFDADRHPLNVRGDARSSRRRTLLWIAAAAAIFAVAAVFVRAREDRAPTPRDYRIAGMEGRDRVRAGDEIVTGDAAGATIDLGRIGTVELEPRTRFRVERAETDHHRFYLDRGSVHAHVFAEARRFQIDTPAGRSIDLGCEYELRVGDDGASVLHVLTGQVAFELDGREVYVPAEASCTSRAASGPSAPVFDDAADDFKRALIDVETSSPPPPASLARFLACDHDEALAVWHVLTSGATPIEIRRACCARIERLFPKPEGVTAEGLIAGDRAMREAMLDSMKPRWRR